MINEYSTKGNRILAIATSKGETLEEIELLGLLILTDKIREEVKATLEYFREQEVSLKIFSGDNPITVSQIAKNVGMKNAEKCIDATRLKTQEELKNSLDHYDVFGRVTPEQKKELIVSLQEKGHTVAMMGDGVNDVMALKEADCSIAMANGSDVAKRTSNLVLLDNNFETLPFVLFEGRRVINNI
ncbi:HAD-IC family P-type ATPase [Enterococcus hirae]|uniref:HAD-IC family P-type ATPase n=1 Tax=Enterococcus hirae TaxID=1354 RepID=UPI001A9789D6|nr:HAD-IC family P-type ATPase [Enterococcus hirae]